MARLSPVTPMVSLNHRSVTRLIASSILCALVLVATSSLAGAASSKASTAKISAHLTKTSFTPAQAGKVKLIYSFSATSKSFSYLLTFKKGSRWQAVKSVIKIGSFKGSKSMTVKQVFAGNPVKVGSYRLKLSADGGSKLLSFKVIKGPTGSGSTGGSKPAITSVPTIAGTTTQGQTLIASRGTWSHSPTSYAYQWRRCDSSGTNCSVISGAASGSYILVFADVGSTIRVVVTASNSHGSASATSSQTAAVAGLPPANTASPSISGTATQGQALSASNGSWSNSPTSYAYQWRRCDSSGSGCADISGATASSYTLAGADVGSTIRVVVTASNSYGSASATSAQTAVVATVPAVSAGGAHSCALLSGGAVKCWGANWVGQLGNGTYNGSSTPVVVSGISNAVAISAGGYHTCALLSGGTVKCWGYNGDGELGNGTTTNSPTPVAVSGITNAVAISAGGYHTCALLSGGAVKCWGYNYDGELGDGTSGGHSSTPVQVNGITNAVVVSAGGDHTCALLSGGTVECWGYNYDGELGNGSTANSPTPVAVSGIMNATAISAGSSHTCALLSDHTITCWGDGSSTPVAVSGITNATAISAGSGHTCALIAGGTVECWGYNHDGELGNNSTTYSSTPVAVSYITNATHISAGDYHTCARLSDGAVECWGGNWSGQLGNGTYDASSTPVQVTGITTATAIDTGSSHTCAVLSGGTVKCWGYGGDGELGDGTTTTTSTSVQVSGITNATAISTGGAHTCALLSGGAVECWGSNYSGQLGNGWMLNRSTPVSVIGFP